MGKFLSLSSPVIFNLVSLYDGALCTVVDVLDKLHGMLYNLLVFRQFN